MCDGMCCLFTAVCSAGAGTPLSEATNTYHTSWQTPNRAQQQQQDGSSSSSSCVKGDAHAGCRQHSDDKENCSSSKPAPAKASSTHAAPSAAGRTAQPLDGDEAENVPPVPLQQQRQQASSSSTQQPVAQQQQQQEPFSQQQAFAPQAAHSCLLDRLQRRAGTQGQEQQQPRQSQQQQEAEQQQQAQQQQQAEQQQAQVAQLQQHAQQLEAENASLREAQAEAEALQERLARSQQAEQLKQVRRVGLTAGASRGAGHGCHGSGVVAHALGRSFGFSVVRPHRTVQWYVIKEGVIAT